jgi:hypothetical protein
VSPRATALLLNRQQEIMREHYASRWLERVPEDASGTYYGLMIHRYVPRSGWVDAVALVPEEKRPDADRYLRGIARRMRDLERRPPKGFVHD